MWERRNEAKPGCQIDTQLAQEIMQVIENKWVALRRELEPRIFTDKGDDYDS